MSQPLGRAQAVLALVLWSLLIADLFLFWSNATLREQAYYSPSYMYRRMNYPTSVPSGYLGSGKRIALQDPDARWVMRYGAKSCLYCKEDEAIWLTLAAELKQRKYVIVTVPLSAQDEYPANSTALADGTQVTFINTSWVKPFRLRKTPTVLIFAGRKGAIWAHEGKLDAGDVRSALKAADHS